MKTVDLRSDTITQPTEAMRRAMNAARVGDDVFGDDPSVIELESRVADLLGKEAALFVPSGTMSNQIALRLHTQLGDRVILESSSHIYCYEAGGMAALSGVLPACVEGVRGIFQPEQVVSQLLPEDPHFSRAKLVCVENTSNRGGGSVWSREACHELAAMAERHGLRTHMDGARLWNAAVATGERERDFAAAFDSVSVCFSKGLGAPVGSALCGDRDFIYEGRRVRKQLGGGMRQAGYLAAGAHFALNHHRARLEDDHRLARSLAEGLAEIPGIELEPSTVETNIVYFDVEPGVSSQWQTQLSDKGIRILAVSESRLRAVTHLEVDAEGIQWALDAASLVSKELS